VTQFDEALLAECVPAELLPERRRAEADRLQLPLRALASAALGGDRWFLVIEDNRGVRFGVPAVVDNGRLRRAAAGEGVSEALIGQLTNPGLRDGSLEIEALEVSPQSGESAIQVDQTNELIRVGAALVKWNLHPAGSDAPGPICSRLLQEAGFAETPRQWGQVHMRVGDELLHVASVIDFVPEAEDGWDWAVADLRSHARGELDLDLALEPSRVLGALIARMHMALSRGGIVETTPSDASSWVALATSELDTAIAVESAAGHPTLGRLRAECSVVLESIAGVTSSPLIRIHGDLHIGQILRTAGTHDFYVIDFDGNPTQQETVEYQPAARDVAGFLCSLDHVARVVIRRTEDLSEGQAQRVRDWIPRAESAFLESYALTLDDAGVSHLLDRRLLAPFRIQQECREYIYADRYLPHWRYVPEAALPALLEQAKDVT